MRRAAARAVAVGLGVSLFGFVMGAARADDKKKAGLFDFQSWKTPVGQERESARTLAPVEVDRTPLGRFEGAPRALRVRVYADGDYRGGVLHWQEKVRTLFERVNEVVAPLFDVRFEIESLREWDRSHAGMELDPVLRELLALDDARGVDLVIGLVTPFRGVATSAHQIGYAPLSSRCFVMRAMDDAEEGVTLERLFGMLPPAERDQLYGDRKAHKELVIFLHEWAHTLGALHTEDEGLIMNPAYDPHQAAFTDFEKRLIGVVLDKRLTDRTRPYPENAELVGLLETAPPEEGFAKERATLVQSLRARGTGERAASVPASADGAHAPATPASSPVGAGPPKALTPSLAEALARLRANDLAGATPLVLAVAKAASAKSASETSDPKTLVQIAEACGAVGALTAGDGALARAGKNAPHALEVAAELDAERSRVALPRERAKAGVAPDDEPRYVAAFWIAIHAVEARNQGAAAHRLAELKAAFPDSLGPEVVACELELEAKHAGAAQKHCEVAVAAFDGAVRAHVALGRIAARAHHDAEAEKHFRRALMFDPTGDDAWRGLERLYRDTGSSTRRDQLAREYLTLFSRPLPE
jgi:hypothetical protein